METISFTDAIDQSATQRRHLLLGNGFSIGAHPEFSYGSLFDQAFGADEGHLRSVFAGLQTKDFELVARRLGETLAVIRCYGEAASIAQIMEKDLSELQSRLVQALAAVHPPRRQTLSQQQYRAAKTFLDRFRRDPGSPLAGEIYTTNYDLLLYWTTLHGEVLNTDDGFRGNPLTWSPKESQSVFHLHGALHLYENDELATTKVTYVKASIIEQIGEKIKTGSLPLFVSEGTSDQKRLRIEASPYLRHGLERFTNACTDEAACLFVFGHALADQDEHIIEAIRNGRLNRVYVSFWEPGERARLAQLQAGWKAMREDLCLPEIEFRSFQAREALPWG